MAQEKPYGNARAGEEEGAQDVGSGTVLDYLWVEEGPESAPAGAEDGQVPPAQTPAEKALQDALARYDTWLNAWGDLP